MTFGEGFVYSILRDELVVGEVYVRVYNLQPTFVLEVWYVCDILFLITFFSFLPVAGLEGFC